MFPAQSTLKPFYLRVLTLCSFGPLSGIIGAADSLHRSPPVPTMAGDWVHVYRPTAAVFPGPDSPRFKAGERYSDWQVNDHAIIKGPDGRWHAFGITHPAVAGGEPNPHEAEWLLFHAAAPVGTLKQHCVAARWLDQPKILPPAERRKEIREIHSPFIVLHDGQYWMFYGYSPIRYATSTDLWSWQPRGELFRQEGGARDPSVLQHDGVFYLSYTSRQSIMVRTSRDLLHWGEPVTAFSLAPGETGGPESPTLLALHGGFYLIWCRWDAKLSAAGFSYQHRSFVYHSDNPLDFTRRDPVAELPGHAPELFQDEAGDWWISSAEWPFRGVSIAPLKWERKS